MATLSSLQQNNNRTISSSELIVNNENPNVKDQSTNIHIGEGVSIVGSITLSGHATVNGSVDGELRAGSLDIGQTGHVSGKVYAKRMTISGELKQEIFCSEHFHIHSTGRVSGNLEYSEIQIDRGGRFVGDMKEVKGK
jgi:cytoskeletal protein CcmA (bactofilin family)